MKIVVINPNSDKEFTALIAESARRAASPGFIVEGATQAVQLARRAPL